MCICLRPIHNEINKFEFHIIKNLRVKSRFKQHIIFFKILECSYMIYGSINCLCLPFISHFASIQAVKITLIILHLEDLIQ